MNERNVAPLRCQYTKGHHADSGKCPLLLVLLAFLALAGLVVWGSVVLLHWLWQHLVAV